MPSHCIASRSRDMGYLAYLASSQHMVRYSWKFRRRFDCTTEVCSKLAGRDFLAQFSVELAIFVNMLYSTFTKRQFCSYFNKIPTAIGFYQRFQNDKCLSVLNVSHDYMRVIIVTKLLLGVWAEKKNLKFFGSVEYVALLMPACSNQAAMSNTQFQLCL